MGGAMADVSYPQKSNAHSLKSNRMSAVFCGHAGGRLPIVGGG